MNVKSQSDANMVSIWYNPTKILSSRQNNTCLCMVVPEVKP